MVTVLAIVVIVQAITLLAAAWVIWQQANRLSEERRTRRRRRGPTARVNGRPLPQPGEEFVAEVRRMLDQ